LAQIAPATLDVLILLRFSQRDVIFTVSES
jgi:hypothetical protein